MRPWPILIRQMSEMMAKTLLAFLMFCLVSLQAAHPAAAAVEEPAMIVSLLSDSPQVSGEDEPVPVSPDAGTKCHDICNWLADWHAPELRELPRSPTEAGISTIPPGFIGSVVPPPR